MKDVVDKPSVDGKEKKIERYRNWSFFLYPESMDTNIFVNLMNDSDRSQGGSNPFSVLISPCHDSDVDDFGQLKKPHYHVMCMYLQPITPTAARRYAAIRHLLLPEQCNKRKMARYLCHLDDKDKHLYNVDDVVAYNCNYLEICGSTSDKFEDYRSFINMIIEHDILYFSDLVDFCKDNEPDLFNSLVSGKTFFLEKYIRERRAKIMSKLCGV